MVKWVLWIWFMETPFREGLQRIAHRPFALRNFQFQDRFCWQMGED